MLSQLQISIPTLFCVRARVFEIDAERQHESFSFTVTLLGLKRVNKVSFHFGVAKLPFPESLLWILVKLTFVSKFIISAADIMVFLISENFGDNLSKY